MTWQALQGNLHRCGFQIRLMLSCSCPACNSLLCTVDLTVQISLKVLDLTSQVSIEMCKKSIIAVLLVHDKDSVLP